MAENDERVKEPEHVSSPEQLDQTITVINHHGWISLVALGVLLVAAIVWGIFGRIPEKVNGSGLIIKSSELMSVTYAYGGTIKNVFIESGSEVQKGQTIARIEREDLLESIQIATQRLANLQQTYDTSVPLITRQADMTDDMLAKSEKDFRSQIENVSKQLETAKMKVKRDTPILTVVQPVTVPTKPSNSRAKTLIIWTFLGAVLGCGIVLGKQYWPKVKEMFAAKEEEPQS